MAWKTIKFSDIPEKEERRCWKADVEDVTAVFNMILNGDECIINDMGDNESASKKQIAMAAWIKQQPAFSERLSAGRIGKYLIIKDLDEYEAWLERTEHH